MTFMDHAFRASGRSLAIAAFALAMLLGGAAAFAAPPDPGRLFFTPAQRAQLEAARTHDTRAGAPGKPVEPGDATAPLRYDGVLIRSDGKTTRWIDGQPQRDGTAVSGLKPGQVRSDGKVYEPYQVLRPTNPTAPGAKDSAP